MEFKERKSIINNRYGRLMVLKKVSPTKYLCACDCGNSCEVERANLVQGRQTSCGCFAREQTAKRMTTHGASDTKLYRVWRAMVNRCRNPNVKDYENYGGRGIAVCDEWANSFPSFLAWALANGYEEGLQIDRIENEKGYSPDNCRFSTQKVNENNRRDTVLVEHKGEKVPLSLLAERHGISRRVLYDRLFKYGFSVEDALALPVKVGNNQSLRRDR